MTPTQIEALSPGQVLNDTEVRGLSVRAFATKKAFYFFYRTRGGQQRRPKVGDTNAMTVAQARRIAREWLSMATLGQDPSGKTAALRGEPRVSDLFDQVWASHWDRPRYLESGWAKEVRGLYLRHITPALGHLKVSELTTETVLSWRDGLKVGAATSNRALSVLSTMLNDQAINPCARVKALPERKRARYANTEEIRRLCEELARLRGAHPREVAFIEVLLHTGSRPQAVEKFLWRDLALVGGCGVLRFAGKSTSASGEKEVIVIPPALMATLESLPRLRTNGSLTGVRFPRALWDRIREAAGFKDLWARDLRRTFATVGMSEGVGMDAIGAVLNHASRQTTMRYAKLNPEARIAAAVKISDSITRAAS